MLLHTRCELSFHIPEPTVFLLMLRPRSGYRQWIMQEEYRLTPRTPIVEFTDSYGNLCQRVVAPEGDFSVITAAEVDAPGTVLEAPGAPFVEIQNLPDKVFSYLLPSRFCESDRFYQMASEITEGQLPGYDQVAAIEDWLRSSIRYEPGSSNFPISAIEVNQRQSGVCRDLSHLGIALCRSLSIPARMVVGYRHGLEPMDLHAWFEAYVGDDWYTFDPTPPNQKGAYVTIGFGRDAADVAIYTQYGPPVYPLRQEVSVVRVD